jgi:hypothetical protein
MVVSPGHKLPRSQRPSGGLHTVRMRTGTLFLGVAVAWLGFDLISALSQVPLVWLTFRAARQRS